jgi:hypothetical protein
MERAVAVAVKEVIDALTALVERDTHDVTDAELDDAVIELHRARSVLDAVTTRLVGVHDARRAWVDSGAKSESAWLAWKCRIPKPRGGMTVANARVLRNMPLVEAAFARGDITADHVRLLRYARDANVEAFARDEEKLLSAALEWNYRTFADVLRYWRYQVNADGEEALARDRYETREAYLSSILDGMRVLDARFDPIGGAIFVGEFERLDRELFQSDWAEAKARLGRDPLFHELVRTRAQRRLDTLVEMAKRSAAMPADARMSRPLITVLVGEDSLAHLCQLSDGTIVTPGEVLPLLCDCDLERIIFDGPSRVLDVGVRRRLFVGATRRAVEVIDRQCQHPSCDVAYDRCDVDHIEPHAAGGLTTQANGRALCDYHNRWRHRRTKPPP